MTYSSAYARGERVSRARAVISGSETGEGLVPGNPRELFRGDTLRQVLWYASVVLKEK
jgi:hypothetical protein